MGGRHAPLHPGIRVIYTSRNAKDACTSAYYHAADPQKLGWPFDAWVHNWMAGLFEFGRWSDHVAGWRAEALNNPSQVLWVRYEDIKADPHREVKRIADFLGVTASSALIDRVVTNSDFAAVKKIATPTPMSNFFRRGVVGDWMNHFSETLSNEFGVLYEEQMRGTDDPYSSPETSTSRTFQSSL